MDFVYQGKNGHIHAFKVTFGDTHEVKLEQIKAFGEAISSTGKNQTLNGDNANSRKKKKKLPSNDTIKTPTIKKFSLYYLVPEYRLDKDLTNPVNPCKDLDMPICDVWHVLIPDPNAEEAKKKLIRMG